VTESGWKAKTSLHDGLDLTYCSVLKNQLKPRGMGKERGHCSLHKLDLPAILSHSGRLHRPGGQKNDAKHHQAF
jgi:hypothetical protein